MQRNLTKSFFAAVIALCTTGLFGVQLTLAQSPSTDSVVLNEVLTIGGDASAPAEYRFTNPGPIRTDSEGRMYIAEKRVPGGMSGNEVRVFDADGTFLGTLGRQGSGPGEFQNIEAIALDSEERLVAYDGTLSRFTRFPPFGELDTLPPLDPDLVETAPQPDASQVPAFMHGLPDGRLMLFLDPPVNQSSSNKPRLHIFDADFEHLGAFGTPDDWDLPDDRFSQRLIETPIVFAASHLTPGTERLVLAPTLYNGTLYRYAVDNEMWSAEQISGQAPDHPTHDVVESTEDTFSLFTSAGVGARYRSTSKGIAQQDDGSIVHLSTAEDDADIRQLQVEVFSTDGALQRVGSIPAFEHTETSFDAVNKAVNVSLLWIDANDYLYLVDRRDGAPVIRIVEIQ